MSKGSEEKWACEICTYENWPSSLKCTMCRSKKPLLGEDIYKLREERQEKDILEIDTEGYLESSNKNRAIDGRRDVVVHGARAMTPEVLTTGSTWPCSFCTFLNSENLLNCLQCDTPRSSTKINKSSSPKPDLEKAKVIYKNSNYVKVESDKVESTIRKLSKSNSQNLSFLSNSDKVSITKSNSQNLFEGKDRNKVLKVNANYKSPEKSCQSLERNSPQNVIIQTESASIDSNIVSDGLEKSPSSRTNRNNRSQNKFNSVNEDVENFHYSTKNNSSINLNTQNNQSVRG